MFSYFFFSSCAIEIALHHSRVIKIPMCKSKICVTESGHISYSWPGESRILPQQELRARPVFNRFQTFFAIFYLSVTDRPTNKDRQKDRQTDRQADRACYDGAKKSKNAHLRLCVGLCVCPCPPLHNV